MDGYLLPTIGVLGLRSCFNERAEDVVSVAVAILMIVWNVTCAYNLVTVLNLLYAPGG